MKKVITMILTIAVAVSGIVVPTDTAKAETVVPATAVPTVENAPTTGTGIYVGGEMVSELPKNKTIQRKIDVKSKNDRDETYANGKTVLLTKGFQLSLSLHTIKDWCEVPSDYKLAYRYGNKDSEGCRTEIYLNDPRGPYKGTVTWTSSNPSVASVNASGVVNGIKTGSAVINAQYGDASTSLTVKVMKNKYTAKLKMTNYGTKKKVDKEGSGFTSMSFDKKGNIVLVFTDKIKLNKYGKKEYKKYAHEKTREIRNWAFRITNRKSKVIAKAKLKKVVLKCPTIKKPEVRKKIIIKKSNIKMARKDIDLRVCRVTVTGGQSFSKY